MNRLASFLAASALVATGLALVPTPARAAHVGVEISVGVPPPALPVQYQPMAPGPGYIWTPGYWSWEPDSGYVWINGSWVMPPEPGLLWTPGYWGWNGYSYRWHAGHWGPTVGFYGDVDYGFGYPGDGYDGGYWAGGVFFYNLPFNHVDRNRFRHVYHRDDHGHEGRGSDWRWHAHGRSWSSTFSPGDGHHMPGHGVPLYPRQPMQYHGRDHDRGHDSHEHEHGHDYSHAQAPAIRTAPFQVAPSRADHDRMAPNHVAQPARQPSYRPPQWQAPRGQPHPPKADDHRHSAQGRPVPTRHAPPPSSHHPQDGHARSP